MTDYINRRVGGLYCTDVLSVLSDYLDGDLPAATRAAVDEHLGGCPNCARFGGEVGELLKSLGVQPEPLAADAAQRLRARLATEK